MSRVSLENTLLARLSEPPPGRIQLITGPRQVGKTTLLLSIAEQLSEQAEYYAADSPESSLPGWWDRVWATAELKAQAGAITIVLIDEIQHVENWSVLLKGVWDRIRRKKLPIHIVATGSSALHLGAGSKESLAGRFEHLRATHWSALDLMTEFGLDAKEAADTIVAMGAYPGAFEFSKDLERWKAYVRDSIVEPAIGRDILALTSVRRPALLRQIFAIAATSPSQIIALKKLQSQLQDSGAIETVAHYLSLLQDANLIAAIEKYSEKLVRSRSAPPKLIALSNAFLAVTDMNGIPDRVKDPARYGAWIENACIAHAFNSGQKITYWREEPHEVDMIIEGSWGKWAVEVKSSKWKPKDLLGLLEFTRRYPEFTPLVICSEESVALGKSLGIKSISWSDFLVSGLEAVISHTP